MTRPASFRASQAFNRASWVQPTAQPLLSFITRSETTDTEALPPHSSHATVRDWMPVSEALRLADLWTVGDLDKSGQWRAAIKVLADEVRAALAQRQQVPEGWMPIKTAPRNGTNILLRFGVDGVSQGKYVVGGFHHPWRFIDTNDGITWMVNYAVDGPGGPSHWMHMPGANLAPSRTAAPQAAEPVADTEFFWLVEEFADGKSTGRFMLDQIDLTITSDVHSARRYRRMRTALFRSHDMQDKHGGKWVPTHHGFAAAPQAAQAQPPCSS